jgi:hypothetical protein
MVTKPLRQWEKLRIIKKEEKAMINFRMKWFLIQTYLIKNYAEIRINTDMRGKRMKINLQF